MSICGFKGGTRGARYRETGVPVVVGALFSLVGGLGLLAADLEPPSPVVLRSVTVDRTTRSVLTTGWVNQVEGAIELLACGLEGKTHESVFVLNLNPVDLQAGLLLLGLQPGPPLPALGEGPPRGSGVELWVDWSADGKARSERAEHFIAYAQGGEVLPSFQWVFTGSTMENGQFKALAEESLVATYWDPWAIFNIPLNCGSNDEALVVNEAMTPPLGTPVGFRFKLPPSKP